MFIIFITIQLVNMFHFWYKILYIYMCIYVCIWKWIMIIIIVSTHSLMYRAWIRKYFFKRLIEYICGCICLVILVCRDGLVGYDAAFTQLRSWVQFPLFVFFLSFLLIIQSLSHYDIILLHIQYTNKYIYNDPRA